MQSKRTFSEKLSLFLKGLAMGSANKVPGVSGGAVAYVLGFYEELIYTFQKINLKAFKLLLSGRFKAFFAYTNSSFLLLVMGGSLFSYFSISILLDYFLQHFEIYVWSAFFGMIIGSLIHIGRKYKDWNFKNSLFAIIGVFLGIAMSFMPLAKENNNLWFVFFCGVIGVSGMTLPGLSGSFILMLMGNYVLLLVDSVNVFSKIVSNLFVGNFAVFSEGNNWLYFKIAMVFFLGSFFGLVVFSHLLGYVLKKWNHIVSALIIGFIAGSLGMVWPWKEKIILTKNGVRVLDQHGKEIVQNYQRFMPDFALMDTWIVIAFIVVGVLIVVGIDYYELKIKKKKN